MDDRFMTRRFLGVLLLHLSGTEIKVNGPQEYADTIELI